MCLSCICLFSLPHELISVHFFPLGVRQRFVIMELPGPFYKRFPYSENYILRPSVCWSSWSEDAEILLVRRHC